MLLMTLPTCAMTGVQERVETYEDFTFAWLKRGHDKTEDLMEKHL